MTLRWYQFFLKTKYRVKIQQSKRLFYILAKKSEYQLHKNKHPYTSYINLIINKIQMKHLILNQAI